MARSAGVDWATEAHEVCVVGAGEVICRAEIPHDERGIDFLCRKLAELEVERVAIERPEGVLVERLLAAGLCVRERYPTEASLAADAGQSPVAVESGKRRVAVFRRACDKRLRGAVVTLANSTRQWHPWAQDICCSDPALHGGLSRLQPSGG